MDKRNNLIEKYLEGDTSLSEEEYLLRESTSTDPRIGSWSQYVKQHKMAIPADFNESLWEEGQLQESNKSRKHIYIIAIALILGLIGIIVSQLDKTDNLDYAAKKELLEQAIAMTAPQTEVTQPRHVIYEDDVLIIYVPQP